MMTKDANELFQSCFAICLLLVPVFGGLERFCQADQPIRGHFCGDRIFNTLSLVCRHYGGFSSGQKKRSHAHNPKYDMEQPVIRNSSTTEQVPVSSTTRPYLGLKDSNNVNYKFSVGAKLFTKGLALSFLHMRAKRSVRQGIICECCYFSCRMSELQEYCNYGNTDNLLDNM